MGRTFVLVVWGGASAAEGKGKSKRKDKDFNAKYAKEERNVREVIGGWVGESGTQRRRGCAEAQRKARGEADLMGWWRRQESRSRSPRDDRKKGKGNGNRNRNRRFLRCATEWKTKKAAIVGGKRN